MYSEKRKFGNIGEEAVANYLRRKGFKVLGRNYLKKWGEIDIIAEKEGVVHFMEVKSVSREMGRGVPHETWRPEENVHPAKLKRLHRAIETWIAEHEYDGDWQIDVAAVEIDIEARAANVRFVEDV